MCEASGSRCDKWLAMSKTFKHNDGDVRIFEENSTGANPNEANFSPTDLVSKMRAKVCETKDKR